jgi:hypothetical protein
MRASETALPTPVPAPVTTAIFITMMMSPEVQLRGAF